MKITTCILALWLSLTVVPALATQQEPDFITLDGERYVMGSDPMELFWPTYKGKVPPAECQSTANWKGYTTRWEVAGDQLKLMDLYMSCARQDAVPAIFQNKEEVAADWYSRALIVARGDVVRYIKDSGSHTPVFPLYTILFIKQGRIFRRMDLDYEGLELLKKERFEKYRGTAGFEARRAQLDFELPAEGAERYFYVEEYLFVTEPGK